jgi:hypothetical protein
MIEARKRTVYYSHGKRKHFITKQGAARAEARSIIEKKYPSEDSEYDEIGCTYRGFNWTEMKRSDVLYRRMTRLVLKGFKP